MTTSELIKEIWLYVWCSALFTAFYIGGYYTGKLKAMTDRLAVEVKETFIIIPDPSQFTIVDQKNNTRIKFDREPKGEN